MRARPSARGVAWPLLALGAAVRRGARRGKLAAMPHLFSYGTLRQEAVQLATFGRLLHGVSDELIGFEQSSFEVTDPEFVAASGKAHHAIVAYNGRSDSRVAGTVFEVTDAELASADAYEPAGYSRVLATLASRRQAWVYAKA